MNLKSHTCAAKTHRTATGSAYQADIGHGQRLRQSRAKRASCFGWAAWIGLILCISADLLQPPGAGTEELRCDDNQNIVLVAATADDKERICSAAQKALAFLAAYDLHLKRPVTIEIINGLIDSNGYIAFGSYNRRLNEIKLMSYQAIINTEQPPQMYDQPFDQEHYQGAVAHEIAHAVFEHNSRDIPNQHSNATQEYLAHATQLGILNAQRRQEIIAAQDVGAWESGDSISEIYMAFNPAGFAVKSYLHLTQLKDPLPFVTILLNHSWFYLSVP